MVPVARSRRVNLAAKARSIEGRAVVVPSMVEVSKPSSNVVVVTPSSVIPPVVLQGLPKVQIDSDDDEKANVTVSHSFSVVSVKYSTASDDLESPPPTLRWSEETERKEERAESLSEVESEGGDLGLPITAVLDLAYQHVPEREMEEEEANDEEGEVESRGKTSSQDVTEAYASLPAVLKVAEIEGLGFQKNIDIEDPLSRQDDYRYEVVNSDPSEPKLDQRAFELDYYVEDEEEEKHEEDGKEIELYEAEGIAGNPYRGQFTGESEKVPKGAEASEDESDGEQMAQEKKLLESEDDSGVPSNEESDELKVDPEAASTSPGFRAPKAVEVHPPSSSSSLLHRVILRLAKNQTYDVVKGTGPPFYPPLARNEQPPAFEFISVALHTSPVSPIQTTDDTSSTTARSASSPAPIDSTTSLAESATMSDDEFDERIYDAIINGDNGLSSFAEGRQVLSDRYALMYMYRNRHLSLSKKYLNYLPICFVMVRTALKILALLSL